MGRDHGDALYRTVADVYVEALDSGWKVSSRSKITSPSAAVARTWGVNQSTANRWVKEARRRGFLTRYVVGKCTGRCPVCCPKSEHNDGSECG